jgi:integral membrane sensor domain MASE1
MANGMKLPALPDPLQFKRFAIIAAATALAYFLVGWLSLFLENRTGVLTAVWPVAGIAAAAAVRFRLAGVAGVFLGSLAMNWGHAGQGSLPYMALGAALGAWMVFWITGKLGSGVFSFGSVKDVGRFCLMAIPVGTLVSAMVCAAGLTSFSALSQEQFWPALWSLWSADMVGAILLAPLLLSTNLYDWRVQRKVFKLEWVAVLLASLLVCWLMFGSGGQQTWEIG